MPGPWNETIDGHRRKVREVIVHVTAALVADRGIRGVTMSEIAEQAGIGRATLYRYFSDVEAVLRAWHEGQIQHHLAQLARVREGTAVEDRLEAVLGAFAMLTQGNSEHDDHELAAALHRDPVVARAEKEVRELFRQVLAEGAGAGLVRDDVPADELADYCLHALAAASTMRSKRAVQRLVAVTLAGLRPAP